MKLSSAYTFGQHLARTYVRALPTVAYRMTGSLAVDPRGAQRFLHDVLDAMDLRLDDPVLGSSDLRTVLRENGALAVSEGRDDVQLHGRFNASDAAETRILREIAELAFLVKNVRPKRIFEIGTFIGRMTRVLALNAGPDCEVITLDLPPAQCRHVPGFELRGTPEDRQVTQVFGDSRTFDFSPWFGKCDFVWVDACHDYEFVVNDTRAAFQLCRPGGWIGWHDYRLTASWSGVTRCVRELKREYLGITHLRGTTTAVLRKP